MQKSALAYFKGVEYDLQGWVGKHPGGSQIIHQYLRLDKNITQIFKSLHSKEAEKMLLQLPTVGKTERNKNQKLYLKIQERVSRLYKPSYAYEILLVFLIVVLSFLSVWVFNPLLSIGSFTLCQVWGAWICHSQLHSRQKLFKRCGKIVGGVVLGLSESWWNKKHNYHHIFTNNEILDKDIRHRYRTILFPFLLFKWRLDSILHSLFSFRIYELIMLLIHYYILTKQKMAFIGVGLLISSFYIAVVVFGNHEREKRYREGFLDNFILQQIQTTTDYSFDSSVFQLLLGGFQYHTEHHLFPQIPFYNLKQAKKVIGEELHPYKKEVRISSMF